jgi:hypothetical protein
MARPPDRAKRGRRTSFMRATDGNKRDASMGGPDKPGHDERIWREKSNPTWVARIRGP